MSKQIIESWKEKCPNCNISILKSLIEDTETHKLYVVMVGILKEN